MEYEERQKVILQHLRPRAKTVVEFMDINPKQEIMVKDLNLALKLILNSTHFQVNYNREKPEERGFWYDAVVTQMRCTSR